MCNLDINVHDPEFFKRFRNVLHVCFEYEKRREPDEKFLICYPLDMSMDRLLELPGKFVMEI